MKKLLLIIAVLLSVNCIAQNRFEKEFAKADSAFNEIAMVEAIKSARETDSIFKVREKPFFYESIWITCISSSKKQNILLSEDDALSLYLDGYMHGQLSYFYKRDFDYNHAYSTLKKIKRELHKLNRTK